MCEDITTTEDTTATLHGEASPTVELAEADWVPQKFFIFPHSCFEIVIATTSLLTNLENKAYSLIMEDLPSIGVTEQNAFCVEMM